ncbi:MAG: ABC transporter substrate-binding protein [Armatimonadota bacterium]|nr:ABC transporter substrate-binding protein [Armatimonadota bacterium]
MTRRRMGRRLVHGLLAALAAAALSGSTEADAGAATEVHIRIAAVEPNIQNYDPHKGFSGLEHRVLYAVFDQLVRFDARGTMVPGLAERWEWTDPRTLVLTLRRGVRFHDGTPFDADAVVFNFRRIMDPRQNSIVRGEWRDVEAVEAVDEFRVKIVLRQPQPAFIVVLSDRSGMMVSPAAVARLGDEFGRRPVGAGPFILRQWIPGSHVTLVRNPAYWETGYPKADRITIYQFRAEEPAVRALKTGAVDFMQGVPAKDVPWVRASRDFTFVDAPTISVLVMSFNLTKTPVDDVNLRRAIRAAIDRRAILRVVYGNIGHLSPSILPRGFWSVSPTLVSPPYDPARARQYLSQSKYAGETLSLVVSPDDYIVRASQLVQQFLGDVGIKAEITPLPGPEQLARFFTRGEFHGRIGAWSGRPDPHVNYFAIIGCGGSFNVPRPRGYCDPRVGEYLEQGASAAERSQRQQAYAGLDRHIIDQVLYIPLVHDSWAAAVRKTLTGFQPYVFGKPIYKELGRQ